MINQVKNNDVLYRDLRALGYEDDKIPAWWYSPGRDVAEGAETGKTVEDPVGDVAEGAETLQTVAEAGEGRTEVEGVEGYDVTPPQTPTPREGRPALQAQLSDPIQSDPIQAEHVSAVFSDAELSLLKDQGVTEITPGRWMRTMEQADDRIVLTPVEPRQELLNIRREAQGERIMGARVRNGTIPLFTRLQLWANVNPSNSSGIPRRILDTWAFQCFHPEDDTWLGTRAHPHNRARARLDYPSDRNY